jgi:hypothetical protein
MKHRIAGILIVILAILLPAGVGMGQNNDAELAREIAFIVVADKYLGGGNSSTSLTLYRDNLQDTYNIKIDQVKIQSGEYSEPANLIAALEAERDSYTDHVNQLINATEQANRKVEINLIHQVVMGGADSVDPNAPDTPNSAVTDYAYSVRADQVQQTSNQVFDGHVANSIPEGRAVVNAVNPGRYNFDAGLAVALVPPSVVPGEDEVTLPPGGDQPGAHPPGSEAPPAGSDETLPPNIYKPVRFTNHGSVGVTVVVESYIPNPQVQPAPRSDASTVVTPITNSSAYLSLPQGTYTFCYYWELEGDEDDDGYFDYAHKVTGELSLNQNSPDEVDLAPSVALSPETNSSPNGRCGEGGNISADGLTPQELSNQGTFQYSFVCTIELSQDSNIITFRFTTGGVNVSDEGETVLFPKVSPNVYEVTDEGYIARITFTDSGFNYHAEGDGESDDCVVTRQ